VIEGDGIRLRPAEPADLAFLAALVGDSEVEPYLAAGGPRDEGALREEIERSQSSPDAYGRLVVEERRGESWERVGTLRFERVNERSRIAQLGGLAIHPSARGRSLGDEAARLIQRYLLVELGYHRLQLEIYGFNERAIRHAERVGFVREGVRRRAYRRHGDWVDGVLFGLLREDLDLSERR
jgi:RimJ/RimL family protein N-acetyltransferase